MHFPQIRLSLRKKWNLRNLASLFKEVTVFKGLERPRLGVSEFFLRENL